MKGYGYRESLCFQNGTSDTSYEYLGVHREDTDYVFRVWAPRADTVYVVGDFNGWSEEHRMMLIDGGIWECAISAENICEGDLYKYKIESGGRVFLKADPYAFCTEQPPNTASVVCDLAGYGWRDDGWLSYRRKKSKSFYSEPMNIYEIHSTSWKRHEDGTLYSWSELATELGTYVKQMGYTHIELMPIAEHPFECSWGYQTCSYFAPTSRLGSPHDFMRFVDSMHEAGIGVLMDWVPAHFPKEDYALVEFDGQPLYEYEKESRRENLRWGTRYFDLGKKEVISFLISNALFWLRVYHIDGLRVDAVSSMIYLDYDRTSGEWTPNVHGDNRALEGINFCQKLNACVKKHFPDVLMVAKESTTWKSVTMNDGEALGFDMKWNMGWTNDTLSYASLDPVFRKYEHEKITFPSTYAFSERYVLPVSHDEVTHGKRSFLDRAVGDYDQKFASARLFFGYQMTFPGKKLLFMGAEIGQFKEWEHMSSVEWFLLDYDAHAKLQYYVAELNHLYLESPPLWQKDGTCDGFAWIDANDRDHSVISYRRIAQDNKELIIVLNFTPVMREGYRIGVCEKGSYKTIFNSDEERFGGRGTVKKTVYSSENLNQGNCSESIRLDIPPLSIVILSREENDS